jgi:4-hydroxymandelate oxidase
MTVAELEEQARARLDRAAYDYVAGGADDEVTLRENCAAFERYRFRYRVLAGAAEPDMEVELFGDMLTMPLLLAPTATQRVVHPDGEAASARAAAGAGTIFCLGTLGSCTIEDIAQVGGTQWFQLYVFKDRGVTSDLVDRALAAGYRALVLTVDLPVLGRRPRDEKNAFALPQGVTYANLSGAARTTPGVKVGESGLARYVSSLIDPSLGWHDLEWLVGKSTVPVLVKGLVRADDARQTVASGAKGVIVSNHGGRQLDHAIATLDALPEVVEAVGAEVPVLMDGGVRRGTDVLKALSLGARAVLLGRAYVWALAVGGEKGVATLLEDLRQEIKASMQLVGAKGLVELTRDLLVG